MNTAVSKAGRRNWLSRSLNPIVWLALVVALPAVGQFTNGGSGGQGGMGQSGQQRGPIRGTPQPDLDQPMTPDLGGDMVYQERRLRQLNAAQHKSMVADTDKLLKLITELNAEISSTNPSSLTSQQLRKIAEIEKLAHSVRDKMRMSVKGATDTLENSPLPPMVPH